MRVCINAYFDLASVFFINAFNKILPLRKRWKSIHFGPVVGQADEYFRMVTVNMFSVVKQDCPAIA